MADERPAATAAGSHGSEAADLAKAFQELAKGERTATALENQLNSMEAKIEALLAQAEREQQAVEQEKSQRQDNNTVDGTSSQDKD